MKKFSIVLGIIALGIASAQAAVIAQYQFTGNSSNATVSAPFSTLVDMGDWAANTGAGQIANNRAEIDGDETPVGINPATDTSYHTFSLTVQGLGPGEFLSVTNVSGDYARDGIHPNLSNHTLGLYADRVGYGSTGDQIGGAVLTNPNLSTSFDISTAAIGNLTNGDTVEFRIYFGDGNSHAFAYTHRLDNITLHGTVTTNVSAQYTFNGNSSKATGVSSVFDMNDWDANTGRISDNTAAIEGSQTPATINPATPTAYHAFSFTVQNLGDRQWLNVTSISGDYSRDGVPTTDRHDMELYSDQVGYTDTGDKLGGASLTSGALSTSFDISTTSIGNLSNGATVEFRFYFADGTGHTFAFPHRLDNIQLHGTVHVPRGTVVSIQ